MKFAPLVLGAIVLCGCSRQAEQPASSTAEAHAPDSYKVHFDTSKGAFVLQVNRSWAPLGADRFYTLVKSGFYDGARFFRVLPGFVVQFGIAADPAVSAKWRNANLPDDPVSQ
ncbi:MAG TPA: peptidylprolyl isomerase, partial [Bryobacteraceae bacterium]|nr:peptidylprolyl isomerase [Bryobacteraceae bacterium]